jgi:hypothetical protein
MSNVNSFFFFFFFSLTFQIFSRTRSPSSTPSSEDGELSGTQGLCGFPELEGRDLEQQVFGRIS